jgi:hypothetical protein
VYFSGKISNSFIQYLGRHGVDTERLFDLTDLPTEFLQDPSCWLQASDMENLLSIIETEFATKIQDVNIMATVGHACFDLKAWGVLDGVLRMMQKPSDIYSQPQRFISYFVSPAPPIGNLSREQESIAFDLPISNSEFPLVTEYLRAALEALPLYVGKNMAMARWRQTKLTVSWSEAQASLMTESEFVVKPQLIQELVTSLERAQRDLEGQKQIVVSQRKEIDQLKEQAKSLPERRQLGQDDMSIRNLRDNVLRLSDYLARGQQLITLLVKQDRLDRQVQEAMRRVDWDYVCVQHREVVEETLKKLEAMKAPPAGPVTEGVRQRPSSKLELSIGN